MWWAERRLLCVSDLHLGKSERVARRGGAILPPYETQDTLERLEQDLQDYPVETVVCLGDSFDGNLRRRDLRADTPFNTYTRAGLPPTPISLPGRASLDAVLNPADTKALYFVARGDGSSQFSDTLSEHQSAVRKFQLNR